MTAGEDICSTCLTGNRQVRIKTVLTINQSSGEENGRVKGTHGKVKGIKRPLCNWPHQSIITVISLLQLMKLLFFVSSAPDCVKSRLCLSSDGNYTGICLMLMEKEASPIMSLPREWKAKMECLQSRSPSL